MKPSDINPKDIATKSNFIKNIQYFDVVDSTNNIAKNSNCSCNTLFVAEKQTTGKGRMGKTWDSKESDGIYMSLVTMTELHIEKIMQITLIAAISVCETLNHLYHINAKIKWPNDIVVDGKKICGILTESNLVDGVAKRIITGIGINVNNTNFPEEISHIAVSLYMLTGKKTSRTNIINSFLLNFERYYKILTETRELTYIIQKYKNLCVNIGMEVTATGQKETICGIATDISPEGSLIITKKDGSQAAVNSGEVSVRGIYGYI